MIKKDQNILWHWKNKTLSSVSVGWVVKINDFKEIINPGSTMVPTLDGHSETGAHVQSDLGEQCQIGFFTIYYK